MELIYLDEKVMVCVKRAGVRSTDEPGGVPELARAALGDMAAPLYPVHRLDQPVGGLLLLARTRRAAGDLGRSLAEGRFQKEYLAIARGGPEADAGTLEDWLLRDRARRRTLAVPEGTPEAKIAALDYTVLARRGGHCLLRLRLGTGRTHQIRVQLAARGWPLLGDRKYGGPETAHGLALWSCRLAFDHPKTGARLEFALPPPREEPWTEFDELWKLF